MQSEEQLRMLIKKQKKDVTEQELSLWVACLGQLKNCHVHSFVAQEDDSEGWLKARTTGIGGSEVACIAGMSPWNSPRDIWQKKTGQFEDEEFKQSEAARWGNVLEQTILDEWAVREGKQFVHIPVSLQADNNPILLANIDGFVVHYTEDDDVVVDGILECKTTSTYNLAVWEEGPLPEYYLCQTNWYTGITGLTEFTIVCLVGGQKLFSYTLPFNKPLYTQLVDAANTFWQTYVIPKVAPPLTAGDVEAMADKVPEEPEENAKIYTDDEHENVVQGYIALGEQISKLTSVRDALKAQIFEMLGGAHEAATISHIATISISNSRKCNYTLMQRKYPMAFEECITASVTKRLNVK